MKDHLARMEAEGGAEIIDCRRRRLLPAGAAHPLMMLCATHRMTVSGRSTPASG
jgi:hypothetical protein